MIVNVLLLSVVLCGLYAPGKATPKVVERVKKAVEASQILLDKITQEWQINEYPLFLKSCSMHKSAWEIMRLKFMLKVLSAAHNNKEETFVASFLGSSVTAGHDSPFNTSFPIIVREYMEDAFKPVNVKFVSRNVALGNNPCVPYDICVNIFAGLDADIVHWEQSYFCHSGDSAYEQFIRQALMSPNRPIVVFDSSETGHWSDQQCVEKQPMTDTEKALLKEDSMHVVTEINKDGHWALAHHLYRKYEQAGIQEFTHKAHTAYACNGPYIKTWEAGAASWHPSIVAHRMRAAHFSYFWLQSFNDALSKLSTILLTRSVEAAHHDVLNKLNSFYHPLTEADIPSPFQDNTTCYTDYEPREIRESSLKKIVISGLKSESGEGKGWGYSIYEDLVDKKIVEKAKSQGYLDFKYLLWANKESGPLSLGFTTSRPGKVFVCQTPPIWGKLPEGFVNFYENTTSQPQIYINHHIADKTQFSFESFKDKAELTSIFHEKKALDLCGQLITKELLPAGQHAITIVPQGDKKIIIAWLLTA